MRLFVFVVYVLFVIVVFVYGGYEKVWVEGDVYWLILVDYLVLLVFGVVVVGIVIYVVLWFVCRVLVWLQEVFMVDMLGDLLVGMYVDLEDLFSVSC